MVGQQMVVGKVIQLGKGEGFTGWDIWTESMVQDHSIEDRTTDGWLEHVHVWERGDQVHMALSRYGGKSLYIHDLSYAENKLIIDWAWSMIHARIGVIVPDYGGWAWWAT